MPTTDNLPRVLWPSISCRLARCLLTLPVAALLGGCGGATALEKSGTGLPQLELLPVGQAEADQPELSLRKVETGAVGLRAELWLERAAKSTADQQLAVYYSLEFDAALYSAVRLEPTGAFDEEGALNLCVLAAPGRCEAGQLLLNGCAATGSAEPAALQCPQQIATIYLDNVPGTVRSISSVPLSTASAAPLSLDDSSGELSWLYANQGDYNQDGQVSVSDLSPIGLNFGASGPFDINSALAIIDGNADGTISVGDLTPIGLNYGCRVESYAVFHSDNESDYPLSPAEPNGPGASELEQLPLSAGSLASGQRLSFSYSIASPGGYFWVRPLAGGAAGTASELSNGSGGAPGTARLALVPDAGIAPLELRLSVADLPGDKLAASFDWDFDADGSFDENTLLAGTTHVLSQPGSYEPRVRVNFEDGSQTILSASCELSSPVWKVQSLPLSDPVEEIGGAAIGSFRSGILSSPRAVVMASYGNSNLAALDSYMGLDNSGADWDLPWHYGNLPAGNVPRSLDICRGHYMANLALVFPQPGAGMSPQAYSMNKRGYGPSWSEISAAGTGSADQLSAICNLDGHSILLMTGVSNNQPVLQVIERTASDPVSLPQWGSPTLFGAAQNIVGIDIAASASGFGFTWLQRRIDGLHDLYYVQGRRASSSVLSFDLPSLLAQGIDADDIAPCLYFIDNRYPAIAFADGNELRFMRCADQQGVLWGNSRAVFSPLLPSGSPQQQLRLAQANGLPLIAFGNRQGDGEVRLVYGLDHFGQDWSAPENVVIEGQAGLHVDMTILQGQPLICCWREDPAELLLARRVAAP